MIYTLTLNPSIDLYQELDSFQVGKIHQPEQQLFTIGGKGINVSLFLKKLGVASVPIAVCGGFTGDYLQHELLKKFDPIIISSRVPTRICVKWKTGKQETAINPIASPLQEEALMKLKKILQKLTNQDILIVSGSGTVKDYSFLLEGIQSKLVLDVAGKTLLELAHIHSFLVKPNDEEIAEVSSDETTAYQLLLKQTDMILHTRGAKGSVLVTRDKKLKMEAIGPILNSVGCGDAYLSGFIKTYLESGDLEKSLHFGAQFAYEIGNRELL